MAKSHVRRRVDSKVELSRVVGVNRIDDATRTQVGHPGSPFGKFRACLQQRRIYHRYCTLIPRLYPVYTIKQTSSRHRANIEPARRASFVV